jgi:Mg-chelatase subunit ChlD
MSAEGVLRRWRLILGDGAACLGYCLHGKDGERDQALATLYDRTQVERGGRALSPSQLQVPEWLARVRRLFPRQTVERVERHALERFGMTELIQDPELLSSLEPSAELLRLLLTFRSQARPELREAIRRIACQVVEDIRRRLETQVSAAFSGRRDRHRRGLVRSAANFDARGTLRANLRHVDPASGRMVMVRPLFHARARRRLPWHVVLCVDQSGSMFHSLLHAAVMASILARLPAVSLRIVLFDTTVVDLTHVVEDPAELMLSVQLGGGTNIGGALAWCAERITQPRRTLLALISDFREGGPPAALLSVVQGLNEAGVTMIGLAALDEAAQPSYDRAMAGALAERGMAVAALTPEHFAHWLAEHMR